MRPIRRQQRRRDQSDPAVEHQAADQVQHHARRRAGDHAVHGQSKVVMPEQPHAQADELVLRVGMAGGGHADEPPRIHLDQPAGEEPHQRDVIVDLPRQAGEVDPAHQRRAGHDGTEERELAERHRCASVDGRAVAQERQREGDDAAEPQPAHEGGLTGRGKKHAGRQPQGGGGKKGSPPWHEGLAGSRRGRTTPGLLLRVRRRSDRVGIVVTAAKGPGGGGHRQQQDDAPGRLGPAPSERIELAHPRQGFTGEQPVGQQGQPGTREDGEKDPERSDGQHGLRSIGPERGELSP